MLYDYDYVLVKGVTRTSIATINGRPVAFGSINKGHFGDLHNTQSRRLDRTSYRSTSFTSTTTTILYIRWVLIKL